MRIGSLRGGHKAMTKLSHVMMIAIVLAIIIILFPDVFAVIRYLSHLTRPDLYGLPDCDIDNDWLLAIAVWLRPLAYTIARMICA